MTEIKLTPSDPRDNFGRLKIQAAIDEANGRDETAILIPRGETFAPGEYTRDNLVIDSYGPPELPLPKCVKRLGDSGFGLRLREPRENLVIGALDLRAFRMNINFEFSRQAPADAFIREVTVRGTLVAGSRSGGSSDSSGMYFYKVKGLNFIDVCFDDNGDESYKNAEDDERDHNLYVTGHCQDVTARRCVTMRSRDGLQLGPGGLIEECISFNNFIGFEPVRLANKAPQPVEIVMRRNIIIGAHYWGMSLGYCRTLVMEDNLFLDPKGVSDRETRAVHCYDGWRSHMQKLQLSGNRVRGFDLVEDLDFDFAELAGVRIEVSDGDCDFIRDNWGRSVGHASVLASLPGVGAPPPSGGDDGPIIVQPPPEEEEPTREQLLTRVADLQAQLTHCEAEVKRLAIERDNVITQNKQLVKANDQLTAQLSAIEMDHARVAADRSAAYAVLDGVHRNINGFLYGEEGT